MTKQEERIRRILIKSTSLHLYILWIWDPLRGEGSCEVRGSHGKASRKQGLSQLRDRCRGTV